MCLHCRQEPAGKESQVLYWAAQWGPATSGQGQGPDQNTQSWQDTKVPAPKEAIQSELKRQVVSTIKTYSSSI